MNPDLGEKTEEEEVPKRQKKRCLHQRGEVLRLTNYSEREKKWMSTSERNMHFAQCMVQSISDFRRERTRKRVTCSQLALCCHGMIKHIETSALQGCY